MIRQIETKLVPVNVIDMGYRRRQPSEAEVDQMVNSIQQDGLISAIGVRTDGDIFSLLYGATRLLAVKKLGWPEVPTVLYEGTVEELAPKEIVENLQRRHLDKDELQQLTKTLVELRTKEIQSEPRKELDDNLSRNSSPKPKTHARAKVEGAKRGRPMTVEGQAKKEVAAKTGQSVRSVQRITSEKPKQATEPARRRSAVNARDDALIWFNDVISELVRRTREANPARFIAIGVAPDDLARLGNYLLDLADQKKVRVETPALVDRHDGSPASTSAEDAKPKPALPDAVNDVAA